MRQVTSLTLTKTIKFDHTKPSNSLRCCAPSLDAASRAVYSNVTFLRIGFFSHMKGNGNQIKPNNKVWNILAVFLLVCALSLRHIVFSAQQDFFHYIFNITTVVSFLISSIGVFAYSNNRAVLFQKFWVSYFYAYSLFTVIYNVHCFQLQSIPNLSDSLINLFVNVGVIALPTLYVLYRYAFKINSF